VNFDEHDARMNRFWTLVVSSGLLLWGLHGFGETIAFKSGSRATGKVVAAEVKGSSKLAPVVEFVAADGKRYQFISTVSSSFFDYKLDQQVPVLYKPSSPSDARIDGFWHNWAAPLFLVGFGGWGLLWFFGVVKTKDGESPFRSDRRRWWDRDD
jgi:hypothetical protein